MKFSRQITNHAHIRTTPGRVECETFVFAGHTIPQVAIDDEMWVPVVGAVVIEIGFALLVFRRGHGRSHGRGTVMHPIDHVATVPGMVTTFPGSLVGPISDICLRFGWAILIGKRCSH